MHRGSAAFGVHRPFGRIAAERFGELFRAFGEEVAEPAFAARRHVQEFGYGIDVAPFQLQAVGAVGTEESLFPGFEGHAGTAGKMAALDAEIVDLLGQVEHAVAFDAKIEKRVEPFAAGIEMHDGAFEFAFSQLRIPGAHARALKTGTKHYVVLIEALDMRGLQIGAAPIEIIQSAPGIAMTIFGFLFLDIVLLQNVAPAQTCVRQLCLIAIAWPQRAGDDDGFEFFRAEHRAAAMGREMIVIVCQHGGAV